MADPGALSSGVNTIWVLTVTSLIPFMQPGFALLEAGQARAENVANVQTFVMPIDDAVQIRTDDRGTEAV